MKMHWALFLPYLCVWIIVGAVVFDQIVPMLIFIICGGVCGGLILATGKGKACN